MKDNIRNYMKTFAGIREIEQIELFEKFLYNEWKRKKSNVEKILSDYDSGDKPIWSAYEVGEMDLIRKHKLIQDIQKRDWEYKHKKYVSDYLDKIFREYLLGLLKISDMFFDGIKERLEAC